MLRPLLIAAALIFGFFWIMPQPQETPTTVYLPLLEFPVTQNPPQAGIITYYDATGAGACSFSPSPQNLMVAAMNAEQWDGSAVCGSYVEVNGPQGSIVVRIVDLCPECKSGHLDLSREAFAVIANPIDGRVAVTWRSVSPELSGPVAYHSKTAATSGGRRCKYAIIATRSRVSSIETKAASG